MRIYLENYLSIKVGKLLNKIIIFLIYITILKNKCSLKPYNSNSRIIGPLTKLTFL